MKRFIGLIVLFVFYGVAGTNAFSQTTQEQLKQMRSGVVEKIDGKDYYIHTVRRGQTLYMISKAYGVDVNEIIRENPMVKEGIKTDQKIRIPVPGQKNSAPGKTAPGKEKSGKAGEGGALPQAEPRKADSVVVVELPCGQDTSSKKPVYRVALMLPLFLSAVEQINTDNPDPNIFETARSFQFLPYYEGFRMALDSLEKTGLRIRLYVYDVDKDTAKTRQLLKKPELKTMDLIFGLLYNQNFQMVASFAKKNHINLVNPISERSELVNGNPFVFKVQPSRKSQAEQLASILPGLAGKGQVIVIRSGQYADREAPERLRKACREKDFEINVVESQEAAIGIYSKEKPNYVVMFADNQSYVLDFLRNLYKLRNDYDLTVIGLPEWSAMEGIELEYLVALRTHVLARHFIDYDQPGIRKFVNRYQERYKTDPELLAFQGYDQAFYFLTALRSYGTKFGRCIGEMKTVPLVCRFRFVKVKDNGFENQQWMVYKFDNYRMVPFDQDL